MNIKLIYLPAEYWNHIESKQELADRLLNTIKKLEIIEVSNENQDLLLLKGIVYYYLYNLDQPDYLDKAIEEMQKIDLFSNHDYRYKWFLGVIYAASMRH